MVKLNSKINDDNNLRTSSQKKVKNGGSIPHATQFSAIILDQKPCG
jgi:hypothetical protein